MKITSAKQAADAIANLSPEKIGFLIRGLKLQHPHLRNKTDAEMRQFLRSYVANNG